MSGRPSTLSLLCLLLALAPAHAYCDHPEGDDLVIVSATHSPIQSLHREQARKLFLGASQRTDGQILVALSNLSDLHLYEVFLQKVLFMSSRHYERLLLSQTFRSGRQRPKEYTNLDELTRMLSSTPGAISYMWASHASKRPQLKILAYLSRDSKP